MIRRALITGVAGGIGTAIAMRLLDEEWHVAGIDRGEHPNIQGLQFVQCDSADPSVAEPTIRHLAAERLDLLVNNAAVQPAGTVLTSTIEDWDEAFAVNIRAAFISVRAAHPALKAARGSVVNMGSVHARATSPGRIAYVATKGALSAFSRACALELAEDGIRVNALLPGAVATPMLRQGLMAAGVDLAWLAQRTPVKRVAEPSEIAAFVSFLASEEASFITGQELVVDGGATARLGTE